jgi:hypothetical protein
VDDDSRAGANDRKVTAAFLGLDGGRYARADPGTLTVSEWEALWTRVLMRYVDDKGRVEFAALAKDQTDLDRVVAFIAAVDPVSKPQRFPDRASRIAFHIIAYNALAMRGVVQSGVPDSLGALTKIVFFYFRKHTAGGKSISLYTFENDVIRPLGEERIHFALNCMVVSCPAAAHGIQCRRPGAPARRRGAHVRCGKAQRQRRLGAARSLAFGDLRFLHDGISRSRRT